MPDGDINWPSVPVGPVLTAGIAGAGVGMLFPSALANALPGVFPATGVAMPLLLGIAGGVGGWFAGKALFPGGERGKKITEKQADNVISPVPEPELAASVEPAKEWVRAEEVQKTAPAGRDR